MSIDLLKEAFEGAKSPENNESSVNKGINNVYPDPPGRAPGTLDAKWGDKPAEGKDGSPAVYGTGVVREAHNGRGEMIERLFDSPKTTAPAEQNAMQAYFAHAKDGQPHSPMLQRGHDKTAERHEESLMDQVTRVVGRR